MGLRLAGVRSDEEGVDPEHLGHVAGATGATVACFTPVLANPVAVTWSARRLDEVAALLDALGVRTVEDDIYRGPARGPARLPEQPQPGHRPRSPPSPAALTAGLRVGAMAAPDPLLRRIRAHAAASIVMVSPLMAAAASDLLLAGDLEEMLAGRRERIARRHRMAREILPAEWIESPARGLHLWVAAPHAWGGRAFVDALRRAGVLVTHGSAFALEDGQGGDRLRVSLGGHVSEEEFRAALETLLAVAEDPPQSSGPVV